MAALAACIGLATAAQAQTSGQTDIGASVDERSLYGTFLAGRNAMLSGEGGEAARRLAEAARAAPEDGFLRERAFTANLFSGDVATAATFAPGPTPHQPPLHSLGRLTVAADAYAAGRYDEAVQALGGDPLMYPHYTAAALLRPWAMAASGDWKGATTPPDVQADRVSQLFGVLARAQIHELRRQPDQAEALYKELMADQAASGLFRPMYGEFLERRGRRAEAIRLYEEGLAAAPDEVSLRVAKMRAERKGRPPKAPTLQEGAAQGLGFAAAVMNAQRQTELSLAYLRLALRIDPTLHQGWLLAGDALAKTRDEDGAREAWGRVPQTSGFYSEARSKIVYSLQGSGQGEAALAMAQETARQRPNDPRAQLTLADMLRTADRHDEAVALLDRMIAGGSADWRLHYMRAISLDRLDRWPEAEADLQKALEMAPAEAEILNYLGYAWIDRGVKVKEGMALVERAVASEPRSGAMQDSLAWAHYRLGDYAKAVELLELAVGLTPADPEINDHLGDAYWMVGRKDEARFQWNRVLTLDPDAEQKASAERKLKDGLASPARDVAP